MAFHLAADTLPHLFLRQAERYSESLCLSLLVAGFYALVLGQGWRRTLGAGLAWTLVCGCRPNLLPLLPLGGLWIFWQTKSHRVRHLGGLTLIVALVFGPILWQNHRISGQWLLRAQQNWNLYAALDPEIGGLHPAAGIAFDQYMKRPILAGQFLQSDQNQYWLQESGRLLRFYEEGLYGYTYLEEAHQR